MNIYLSIYSMFMYVYVCICIHIYILYVCAPWHALKASEVRPVPILELAYTDVARIPNSGPQYREPTGCISDPSRIPSRVEGFISAVGKARINLRQFKKCTRQGELWCGRDFHFARV